ncbi:hypothetical protein EV44_g5488 [Erysiphe necator]|uniref:Reverse transcriptase domain-containing protein n=1 Tax=Uncinula necator TaxID=52586 RepID=A0A0B1P774_UNCNE|nr:hypothetical protein EV44_g5488 [Erysiphe necator]
MRDITQALKVKSEPTLDEIEDKLPPEIKFWSKIFKEDQSSTLPPHRASDIKINLQKDDQRRDKQIPWGPLYNKGWIRASASPGGAPVLFVKKPGGGLRFCVDYLAFNAITGEGQYPLPLIKETLRSISKSTYITKVDVRATFHKLSVREGDEEKNAFLAFQRYVNETLVDYLDVYCTAYLDDIFIYTSESLKDHWQKIQTVFKRLNKAGLKLNPKKCEFAVKTTKYLGFVISLGKGIKVDPEKVEAIKSWVPPTSVKGVRSFIGFANFYRDFIPNFSQIAQPLLKLTKKDHAFIWLDEHQKSFESLKELFLSQPRS